MAILALQERLSAEIYDWLAAEGHTQEWLAEKLGYSIQMANRVLARPRHMSDQFVCKLSHVFPDRWGWAWPTLRDLQEKGFIAAANRADKASRQRTIEMTTDFLRKQAEAMPPKQRQALLDEIESILKDYRK